ncbi:MAG: M48 family metalloprotease [Saprospiraceae bacterium]|nr:M48 family metalloprotease [Saprospiraceae bacterium]MCB0622950.1 M48 family metalloprotease [Saprospiraceae bacterium]MCB0682014.1 M48 family metalloprotease [Saprospiraceae bacterium]
MHKQFGRSIFLTGLFVLLFFSCAVNPVTGKKEFSLLSTKGEKALGAASDPDIIASFGLYEDPKIQAFVDRKGLAMARISHRPNLDYQFRVLDSPVVNAFAVPGGYVYFTRGILAHFNNEAEFAGVLGHEIGHIAARHSAKQYSNQVLAQALLIGGMVVSEDFRQYAGLASTGLQLLFLKFSRDHESQSDKLGVEYSTRIGYDAHHMAGFFKTIDRLGKQSGQSVPDFLSTHPNPLGRYKNVNELTDKWQDKSKTRTFLENRTSYLQMIDGLVYGEDPRQGFVEEHNFYHPELKFQFPVPNGWATQNAPTQFLMAPSSGKAIFQLSLAAGTNLQAAAQTLVDQFQLTLLTPMQSGRVNGLNALQFTADQTPQQEGQQAIRLLTYLIQYDGRIYQMIGMTAAADFAAYSRSFEQVMENFRPCKDPKILNRQPERIRIKTVQSTGTLKQALLHFQMPADQLETLAILNGMELTDRVEKGTLIKTIGD